MAASKKATNPTAMSRELASLKQRVKWLEAALKPRRGKPTVDRSAAASRRETAEREARRKALSDYYAKCHEDRLRRNPWMLKSELESERETNEFLKSRGFKPNPSTIPKSLRRKARNLREEQP
jgi:hypothetical protein